MSTSETTYDRVVVTPEIREDLELWLPSDQLEKLTDGEPVSVYRFPLTGGAHGTITVYWEPARFALEMGGPSDWGDVGEEGGLKLYLDDAPEPVGGNWWIDPELAAWVEDYALEPIPLDPAAAIAAAKRMGEEWAGGIDTYELLVGEDLSPVIVNANAPSFPNFPSWELYDVAYDAAIEVLESALLERDEEED